MMNLIEPLPSLSSLNVEVHSGATEALYHHSCQFREVLALHTKARRHIEESRVLGRYGGLRRPTLMWMTTLWVSNVLRIL